MKSPVLGKVSAVMVKAGDAVEANQPLLDLQSNKLNTTLLAEVAGNVQTIAAEGKDVKIGEVIVKIQTAPGAPKTKKGPKKSVQVSI